MTKFNTPVGKNVRGKTAKKEMTRLRLDLRTFSGNIVKPMLTS
jgi:hypothetical protein